MALVIFESQVNMLTVATPSIGGFIVAYDLDGKLKQKDSNGVITLVGATGYAGPLVDTLALGNNSGTYSIVMGNNTAITSAVGTASIKLDNNFIRLSTDGDSYQESYITISPTQVNLTAKGGSSSILLSDSVEIAYKNTDKIYLTNDLFYVTLNGDKVVNFTTSTASQPAGPKISGVISSDQSYFSTLVTNSLILGGNNIVGTQSNSVYVPNILSQGPIKGIDGAAQLDFSQYDEAFLTSGDYMIGLVSSSASLAPNKNGIIIVDNLNSFSTTGIVNTGITYISSVNSSNNSGIVNSVVIGGFGLSATESNTVYLGNNVNINNAYKLPITDGSANQVIITDGMGNLSWGSSVSNQVITITAASFSSLSSYMANTTYRITDADSSLYGGTEIYLSTNASGVLNDKGVGKFYNPKYNQAITGYGIWAASASYATSSTAIWGNYLWENINGTNVNAAIDQFTLNPTEWNVIPYNNFNYNISYDEIKYDVVNNKITYRNERNTNIVNTSYDKIQTASFSSIKSFQWGNLYNTSTQKGVGSVKIDGTFINLINATGSNFTSKNYFGDTVYIGTASVSATTDRFVVSNSGTASLVVDINGNVYNRNKGLINTLFGFDSLLLNTTGTGNAAFGYRALRSNTTGSSNTALGSSSLLSNTNGYYNVGIGASSLFNNIGGFSNIAIGFASLYNNTTGSNNVAVGVNSLLTNTTGLFNNAFGSSTLANNINGSYNSTFGHFSQYSNTTGTDNSSFGYSSLFSNTTGSINVSLGNNTLYNNTIGSSNIAIGAGSLYGNISGDSNIAIGSDSLHNNIDSIENIAIGHGSLFNSNAYFNLAIGSNASYENTTGFYNTVVGINSFGWNVTGSYNVTLGSESGPAGSGSTNSNSCIYIGFQAGKLSASNTNEIVIGATANGNGSNSVTLGNDSITKTILKGNVGIGATVTPATVNIKGTLNYQVNTATSSFTANGEIVYYGNGVGMTAGYLYALERDTGNWVDAENKNYYDCHLAIALGSTTEFGMLTKGYVSSNLPWYTMKTGRAQYLGNTASQFQENAPNSGTLRVRIIGYPVGNGATTNMLYFNPDNMWLAQSVYILEM